MNKRGLSNTISVMLLIAIAIAAVVLIWFYLRADIINLSKQIKTECVILHLEPSSCLINSDNSLSISLKRNPGGEKVQLKTAKLLFTFDDDSSIIKEAANLPQTITPIINLQPIPITEIGSKPIKSIRTSAVIEYEDKTRVCELSTSEIKCSRERVLDDGSPTLPGTNCGNSVIEAGEQCDDGNSINTDTCNACTFTTCGDSIIQNPNGNAQNEVCDDGTAANGIPGNCNLQCNEILPTVPSCGPTPSWVYLDTWFYDNFVDTVLDPFWPADVRNNWILDPAAMDGSDVGILTANRDLDSKVVTINGKFDFDIGYTYRNNLTSIGFNVNETFISGSPSLRYIFVKASPSASAGGVYLLRARDYLGGANEIDRNTTRRLLSPINRTDTRLIRNLNNNFTWLYKQDTAPYTNWQKLYNVTGSTYNLNTNMTLFFDEGSVNNLRYVKLQADEGLPCKKL